MKRALSIIIASVALAGFAGCANDGHVCRGLLGMHHPTGDAVAQPCPVAQPGVAVCPNCRGAGCPMCMQRQVPPSAGTVTYPYYTLHGPRDFFAKDTPSIGP